MGCPTPYLTLPSLGVAKARSLISANQASANSLDQIASIRSASSNLGVLSVAFDKSNE